jgi:hypothetical protein
MNSNRFYTIPPQNPARFASTSNTMAFTATPAFTGVPEFGLIHIDPIETANAFQTYLDTASKLTGVSLDNIDRSVIRLPANVNTVNLVDLLKLGMKLFDAIIWLTAGRPASHPLQMDPGMRTESIPTLHDVARSVFFCYFMLITQARYPVGRNSPDKPKIPNFLRTIMGMDAEQHVYVEMICSFEPQKFDPKWAQYVSFRGFGQEVISRFGLGVAGYRMFGPFGLYKHKPDMSPELLPAFEFAQKVAKAPGSWAIHPLTRDPNILTARGNLNKNLGNLILDAFSEEQIAEMVAAKIIFAKPEREPTHRNYYQWTADDDITGNAWIFTRPQ